VVLPRTRSHGTRLAPNRFGVCSRPGFYTWRKKTPSAIERTMNSESDLRVDVVDDEIVVTLPGSHYSARYYKAAESPKLLAKFKSDRDDPHVAMKLSEFLARARNLANDKARELGWGWVL
jgi:hypothetical protein